MCGCVPCRSCRLFCRFSLLLPSPTRSVLQLLLKIGRKRNLLPSRMSKRPCRNSCRCRYTRRSDEKLLNEAGDGAALAITRIVGEQEMNSPETGKRILLILHLAFEVPQSIIERNKTPKAALRLLDQLEHTDYGRQPNLIGNARFEIKHNSSTGWPLEPVTLPGEPVIDWGHTQWVGNVLAWIATIKPGMTRSDLLRVFTTEGGLSTRTHRTYVLKQCPTIKVDVEFSISGNEAEDKITQISRPYLDYGHYD